MSASLDDDRILERFVKAQCALHETALKELQAGKKQSHWMWFFFPQIKGLGKSEIAIRFAIADWNEAGDYFSHPILGKRLVEFTNAVLKHENLTALEIFGEIDALKFKSCMTLFNAIVPEEDCFKVVLNQLFDGRKDELTLGFL